MKIRIKFFLWAILLCGCLFSGITAQTSAPFHYELMASAADGCGAGGIRFFGYSLGYQSPFNWSVYGQLPSTGIPGGYLAFSWTLVDEAGPLASGSYDSRTGVSTGGTYGSSWSFTIPRYPVGDMSFQANGSVYGVGGTGNGCLSSFNATTYTTISSGGYFILKLQDTFDYEFENLDNGLLLQIANSSTADYEPAIQDNDNKTDNTKWNLSDPSGLARYTFTNAATNKPLFSNYQSGSALVYQLTGSSPGWRFISTGDGSSFYISYSYYNFPANTARYGMGPVGGSATPGASIEAAPAPFYNYQKWLVHKVQ